MTLLDIGCGWGACMMRAVEIRRQRHRPDALPQPDGASSGCLPSRTVRAERSTASRGGVASRLTDRVYRRVRALRF
jgi:hypothetical protein